jgi:hypothetical protein
MGKPQESTKEVEVGVGASIVMIALGAILRFALPGSVLGIHFGVIGVILMVVGVLGLVVALLIWGPRYRSPSAPDSDVVEERRVYGRRPPY